MNNTPSRWNALELSLQEVIYERLRGKGVGVVHVTLIVVDGALSCWSEPRTQTFGPFSATKELADCLADLDK